MKRFTAILTILFSFLFALIPFFLVYALSEFVRLVLYNIVGYRKKVVLQNLRESFPFYTEGEIKKIAWGFYRNLSDVLLEGIKAFTMTRSQVARRHKVLNPELSEKYFKEGRSVIAVPCHYNNWEWGSMSGAIQLSHNFVVFYKPLRNKWVDQFARWSRGKFNSEMASIYETSQTFRDNVPKNSVFVMAADQSPSNVRRAIWVKFLGRDTTFLHGPEFYARKYDLPVIFVDIQRKRRGYYELTLDLLTDDPKSLPQGEITQLYARRLEKAIKQKPENWLWSHRRWKHKKETTTG